MILTGCLLSFAIGLGNSGQGMDYRAGYLESPSDIVYVPSYSESLRFFNHIKDGIKFGAQQLDKNKDNKITDEEAKAIVLEFGSLQKFWDQYYYNQAQLEFFYQSLPVLENVVVPRLSRVLEQYSYYEIYRETYNRAIDQWESGKPYLDAGRARSGVLMLWSAASRLEREAAKRKNLIHWLMDAKVDLSQVKVGLLENFSEEDLSNEDITTFAELLIKDDGKIEEVFQFGPRNSFGSIGASLRAVEVLTHKTKTDLEGWSSDDPSIKVPAVALILFLWRMSFDIEHFQQKMMKAIEGQQQKDEPIEIEEGDLTPSESFKLLQRGILNTRDWLEGLLNVQSLTEKEQEQLADLECEHLTQYYFCTKTLAKELENLKIALAAKENVSHLVREIVAKAQEHATDQLLSIRESLPFTELDGRLPRLDQVNELRLDFNSSLAFRKMKDDLLITITQEDMSVLLQSEEDLALKIKSLKQDYRDRFLDPNSEYVKRLHQNVGDQVLDFYTSLEGIRSGLDQKKRLLDLESLLRIEMENLRFNSAALLLETMRYEMEGDLTAFYWALRIKTYEYQASLYQLNTRSSFVDLLSSVYRLGELLTKEGWKPAQDFMALLPELDLNSSENRLLLENAHRTAQQEIRLRAKQHLLNGVEDD